MNLHFFSQKKSGKNSVISVKKKSGRLRPPKLATLEAEYVKKFPVVGFPPSKRRK